MMPECGYTSQFRVVMHGITGVNEAGGAGQPAHRERHGQMVLDKDAEPPYNLASFGRQAF
ncbi:hypothetical protein [Rugamonas fusca]|uniref:hypothetical protein n=1 Tax=Rugamonas fusca TaxID=2758568 RepID=UPI0015F45998|nr:hypothetical protein [Rugamonas fusca]